MKENVSSQRCSFPISFSFVQTPTERRKPKKKHWRKCFSFFLLYPKMKRALSLFYLFFSYLIKWNPHLKICEKSCFKNQRKPIKSNCRRTRKIKGTCKSFLFFVLFSIFLVCPFLLFFFPSKSKVFFFPVLVVKQSVRKKKHQNLRFFLKKSVNEEQKWSKNETERSKILPHSRSFF